MCRRWGVGFYRGGQSLGSTQEAAYPNSDPDSNSDAHSDPNSYAGGHSDPNSYAGGHSDPDSNGDAHSAPDGYTNGYGYVYADANSVTRALCTRCHCGH